MKSRVFYDHSLQDINMQIQRWLDENQGIEIVSHSLAIDKSWFYVHIIYKEIDKLLS